MALLQRPLEQNVDGPLHDCGPHAHTLGKTFYIEEKAGIVAAYIDKGPKRIAEA